MTDNISTQDGEHPQETVERPCPGCSGTGRYEYYAEMLDCGRCKGTGVVVYDVCSCCGSLLHERSRALDGSAT